MLRKLGSSSKPTVEFSVAEDGTWLMKTISTLKTTEVKFKPGEEITETTLDGRECKVSGGGGMQSLHCFVYTRMFRSIAAKTTNALLPHRRYSRWMAIS